MILEQFRNICSALNGATEDFPFDEKTLVCRVAGKIFAITNIDSFEMISVKCDPADALFLREKYAAVIPGYHLNKRHWNSIMMDGTVSDELLSLWIRDSYNLVVSKLPVNARKSLDVM